MPKFYVAEAIGYSAMNDNVSNAGAFSSKVIDKSGSGNLADVVDLDLYRQEKDSEKYEENRLGNNDSQREKYIQNTAQRIMPYVEKLDPANSDIAKDFSRELSEKVYDAVQEKPVSYKEAMDYFNVNFLK